MKVTSFTDSIQFAAKDLVDLNFAPEVQAQVFGAMRDLALAKDPAAQQLAKEALIKALPEKARAALKVYGAELPTDVVTVNVDFGSFLFDCYRTSSIEPSAPLRKLAHNKRMQDLAVLWEKDSFDLADEDLAVIRKTVDTDEVWKGARFASYVNVGDKVVDLTLVSNGIQFYAKIMEAVVNLFDAPKEAAPALPALPPPAPETAAGALPN